MGTELWFELSLLWPCSCWRGFITPSQKLLLQWPLTIQVQLLCSGGIMMYNLNNIQSFCELIFNLSSKSKITNNWPMEAKLANKDNNKYQNSNHLSLSEPRDLGPRTSFWKPVSGLENSSASYFGDRDRKAKNWAYMDFSLFCHQNCPIWIIFTHLPVQPCFSLDGTV